MIKVKTKKKSISPVAMNLALDAILLIGLLLVLARNATGPMIHQPLGAIFTVFVGAHLLLHWDWTVATTKRIFQKMSTQVRLKAIINFAIFIDMGIAIVSGLLISGFVFKTLGTDVGPFWHGLHIVSSDSVVWLIGLHIAMSWKWIVNAAKQHIGQPILHFVRRPVTTHS